LKTHQFFRVFILQHNVERFATNLYRHKQPFWYYLPVFVLSVLPWTVYVIAAMAAAVRGNRSDPTADAERCSDERWRRFLLIWTAVPLVLFTISQSKLPGYILPAIPPGALLLAGWLRGKLAERARISLAMVHSLVCGAMLGGAILTPYFIVRMHPPAEATTIAAVVAAVIALAMIISLRWQGLRALRFVTLVPVVLGLALILLFSAPVIDRAQSARPVANELSQLDPGHSQLAAFNVPRELEYGLGFYRNQPVMRYERGEVPAGDHLLMARSGPESQLDAFLPGRQLLHVGGFAPQHLEFYRVSSGTAQHHQ
jgi:4-amino-4-deoxy-L-arabinose transferase-like glycosyltransferase